MRQGTIGGVSLSGCRRASARRCAHAETRERRAARDGFADRKARRQTRRPGPMIVCLLAISSLARAEIIDRVAVSVGNSVITTGDIDREIRVTAFLNGSKPDFSSATKRATAQRLIEQNLIRRELELTRFVTPEASAAMPMFLEFRKNQFPNEEAFQQALKEAGITEQDLQDELLWQLTLLNFVDVRFRPGVQVTDQELHDYFEKVVRPVAQAAHPGEPVQFEDYRSQMQETLNGSRADQEMDQWLRDARKRTDIVIHEEALQ